MRILPAASGAFLLLLLSAAYKPVNTPENPVQSSEPDYALEQNWAALPFRKDSADFVPPGTGDTDNQDSAAVDVFYVHPTLYFDKRSWNAAIDNKTVNKRVDMSTMKNQASVFNASCKVYAPRYRQASLWAFFDQGTDGRKALDKAYGDVKKAFRYYLDHYNNGRPIIIAGHSQGTNHAIRLIDDFFENDSVLRKRLVAAYLVGGDVNQGRFTRLQPCENASETGCYVAWHTVRWGSAERPPKPGEENAMVFNSYGNKEYVNPLTWRRDTIYASAALNKGSLPRGGKQLDVGIADAKVAPDFQVWVHQPKKKGYPKTENYHIADYSLFYMSIRANVAERVNAFLKQD